MSRYLDIPWKRVYVEHFQHYFGKPFDVQTYRPEDDSLPLRLATYDHHSYRNYRIFASLGLTAYADEVKDTGEVILLADAALKDVPFLFVNALFFLVGQGIPISARPAIGGVTNLNQDFADYFDKAALYFTLADGFGEGFEEVECNGQTGQVYQAVFISEAEQRFLDHNGADAFEKRYRAQDADPCSLRRPSCV